MILMRTSLNKLCVIWKSDWFASWDMIFHGSNTHAHASYDNTQNTVLQLQTLLLARLVGVSIIRSSEVILNREH